MTRIVKRAEERKSELLDCAQALFLEKGYEATTIADILQRTGLSKGAFYHHFSSKEELLDAFTDRFAKAILSTAQDILKDESITELERLNLLLERTGHAQTQLAPAILNVYLAATLRPENALLFHRINAVAALSLTPVLVEIVRRGAERGEFDVPDAQIVGEMIHQLSNIRRPLVAAAVDLAKAGELRRATDLLEQRLAVEQRFLDRLLGLAPGSVVLPDPEYAQKAVAILAQA